MEALVRLLASKLVDWLYHDQGIAPIRGELPDVEPAWKVVPYPPLSRWSHWKTILFEQPSNVFIDPFTHAILYLGSSFNAADDADLKRRKIRHVVNVSQSIPNLHVGIVYFRVSVRDVAGARLVFNTGHAYELITFIHERLCNGQNVLVHCWAGSSRSASVVLLYLLWRRHFTNLVQAYDRLTSLRAMISVNREFLSKLEEQVHMLQVYTHVLAIYKQVNKLHKEEEKQAIYI